MGAEYGFAKKAFILNMWREKKTCVIYKRYTNGEHIYTIFGQDLKEKCFKIHMILIYDFLDQVQYM